MTTFERGLIHGLAIAAAYMARQRDEPTYASEIITEQGYGWRELRQAGVDEYDLEALRPILGIMSKPAPTPKAGEKREAGE